ncbi:MAG: SufE family protein [Bacteroidia bacterium]
MTTIEQTEKEIVDDFELFDEWTEKYQYIIELGQKLPKLDAKYYTDENKIKGCQSSVWMHCETKDDKVQFAADSDSTFVKGLVSLLIRVLNNRKPEEIINTDLKFIDAIGLRQHLAQTRANGLSAMIKQMKLYAIAFSSVNS